MEIAVDVVGGEIAGSAGKCSAGRIRLAPVAGLMCEI